jgi:hypothetical protein
MSYQISFVPILTINGKPITLSELRDKARPIGYEYTAKTGEDAIFLGTLGQLVNDLETLMNLGNVSLISNLQGFIPDSVFGRAAQTIIGNIENTGFSLTHIKLNTETKDKEISITGSMNGIEAFGITANGFSLNISSGPDGNIKTIDTNKIITVTLNERGSALLTSPATGQSYSLQSYNTSGKKVTLKINTIIADANNGLQVVTFDPPQDGNLPDFSVNESIELSKP